MSVSLSNVIDAKPIGFFFLKNIWKVIVNIMMKRHLVTVIMEKLNIWLTLESINALIISLVMSYVGFHFKLLQMSWYKSMKPFRMNLKLVMKIYLGEIHDSFTDFDSSYNYVLLNGMSE